MVSQYGMTAGFVDACTIPHERTSSAARVNSIDSLFIIASVE